MTVSVSQSHNTKIIYQKKKSFTLNRVTTCKLLEDTIDTLK